MKENLWSMHFEEYGSGVSMYRTPKIQELVMKVIVLYSKMFFGL